MSSRQPERKSEGHPLDYLGEALDELRKKGSVREASLLEAPQAAVTTIDGRRVINMAANNYLGLANHPRVKKAAMKAVAAYGAGLGSARNACGEIPLHRELEGLLAEFKQVDSVLCLQTGYAANAGLLPALLDQGDAVVSDALNHASLIDSARMSRARILTYAHLDHVDAERKLVSAREEGARHVVLMTDGVFSMDGDVAPLPELVAAAERHGAITLVDEAHALGVLGHAGRGSVSHFGLEGRVDIQVGTLSKALGSMGGYIGGKKHLIEWLEQRHRPFYFSASTLTPADTAAALEALRILIEEPGRVDRLRARSSRFRERLRAAGFEIGGFEGPLVPLFVGVSEHAETLRKHLFELGVYVVAVAYPIVPRGGARLRLMVSSEHDEATLDEVLAALCKARKELRA